MHDISKAIRDRDIRAILHSLSPDVTYHSPVMRQPVIGAGVAEMMKIFCEVVTSVQGLEEYGTARTLVLVGAVTVGSSAGDATWVLRLDGEGKVYDISWQARPFKTVVCLSNAFSAALARRRGGVKPALAAVGRPVNLLVASAVDLLAPLMAPPVFRKSVDKWTQRYSPKTV